nr:MAG: 4-oxalocrotonate decarboxylase [Bacillota bacterium]
MAVVAGARAARAPVPSRGGDWEVDLAGAYRVQAAGGRGRPVKGYKLGLVSPAKQAQMGIATPIYGRIYPEMLLDGEVVLSRLAQPRFEPEIAVVLRDPVPPGATPGVAWQAVGGLFLGLDVLDSIWLDYRFTAAEVVADNCSGGAFLLGPRLGATVPRGPLRLYLGGALKAEGPVEALGDPGERLAWLARQVGGLQAGQVVFLGSPAGAVPAEPGVLEVTGPGADALIARAVL